MKHDGLGHLWRLWQANGRCDAIVQTTRSNVVVVVPRETPLHIVDDRFESPRVNGSLEVSVVPLVKGIIAVGSLFLIVHPQLAMRGIQEAAVQRLDDLFRFGSQISNLKVQRQLRPCQTPQLFQHVLSPRTEVGAELAALAN